jgi:DNA-binding transcriptional MerR regulator
MRYPTILYSRQEIAVRIGMSDDVLSFWIRQGLLKAVSGGAGKGSHRKFDLFQVNIAAVLAELRRFGVNIAILRVFAGLLQRGTALALRAECNFWGISDALDLAELIARFRAGDTILVSRHDVAGGYRPPGPYDDTDTWAEAHFRNARDEADIVEDVRRRGEDLRDDFEPIGAFASLIEADDITPLHLFFDLNHLAFRYVWEGHFSNWGDTGWVVVPNEADKLDIYRGAAGQDLLGQAGEEVRSGLFLGPSAIFRKVWGDGLQPLLIHERPPSEERRAARQRSRENSERLRKRQRKIDL